MLIRQWLRIPTAGGKGALALLPFAIPTAEFREILSKLSQEERRLWLQSMRAANGQQHSHILADSFIGSQVIEAMLAPELPISSELQERLLMLSARDLVQLIVEEPNVGPLIVSVLPNTHVARIYDLLPEDIAREITPGTLGLSIETSRELASVLKAQLDSRTESFEQVPFLDKAMELLKVVGPAKEKAIFGLLAEAGRTVQLESAARQFFPAELISKLPDPVIRASLDSLDSNQRAALIFSRKPEQKNEPTGPLRRTRVQRPTP